MDKKSNRSIVPSQGGTFQDIVFRIKLIYRLMGDKRVNPWLKLVPVAGLLYLISPLDLIPDILLPVIGELDDIAILWLTNYFFVELCPPEVVKEIAQQLSSNNAMVDKTKSGSDDDIIDAESKEIKD